MEREINFLSHTGNVDSTRAISEWLKSSFKKMANAPNGVF